MLGLPFEIEGIPEITDSGDIRIRTASIQAVNIEVSDILDLVGIRSEDLIDTDESRGLRVEGDDLVLSPTRMLPPPEIRGRVTELRVQDDGMVLVFGPGADAAATAGRNADDDAGAATAATLAERGADAGNYLLYRGGTTRIGRMTMTDTDIRISDASTEDPFGFDVDRIHDQLVVGYILLTPDGGLRPIAPDFQDLEASTPAAARR
jgi:hypothetical protein